MGPNCNSRERWYHRSGFPAEFEGGRRPRLRVEAGFDGRSKFSDWPVLSPGAGRCSFPCFLPGIPDAHIAPWGTEASKVVKRGNQVGHGRVAYLCIIDVYLFMRGRFNADRAFNLPGEREAIGEQRA